MKGFIVSGGTIDQAFVGAYMERETAADLLIAADRGISYCRMAGIEPDLILGDFDSAAGADLDYFKEQIPERIRSFPPEKDQTDTELAVWAAAEAGCTEITVFGATGTRLDHVLGNIHLLEQAADRGIDMELVDAHNRIRMLRAGETFSLSVNEQFGTYVSLIPHTPSVRGLTLTGFAYNLEGFTLRSGSSLGVSNQLAGEQGTISFSDGLLLVIESKD